jgi:hypothetical protein
MMRDLTPAQSQVIDLLIEIEKRTGHGRLVIDVVGGTETMFELSPTFKIKPAKT